MNLVLKNIYLTLFLLDKIFSCVQILKTLNDTWDVYGKGLGDRDGWVYFTYVFY